MAKGENIFHRKDGRWEARYIKGYELSGKIKYGFCYGKHTVKRRKRLRSISRTYEWKGRSNQYGKASICLLLQRMASPEKGKIRESTYIKYSTVLEKHIKPKLADAFAWHQHRCYR